MTVEAVEAPHPHRDLWGMRLFFLFLTGGAAFFTPFLGLFYRENGLSGAEIGLLSMVGSVAALIAAPAWGRWTDHSPRPRLVLQIALAATTVCVLAISQQRVFIGFLIVNGLYALLNSGIEPVSNRLALRVVQQSGEAGFGSVRLWGSLGWAVMVLLSGWLIESSGSLLTAFAGAMLLQAASVLALSLVNVHRPAGEAEVERALVKGGMCAAARGLLGQRIMLGLAAALIVQWLVLSGIYQFQAIYLKQLGAGEGLIGIFWMISAAAELPGMWLTDRLVKRYGAGWVLAAAFLFEGLRTIPVLIWPSIPAMIGAEVITGLAYSFLWVGMVVFVNEQAGSRQTTMQALYTVTLPGLTQIIGGPLSGLAFDRFGAYWLYALMLGGSLLAWLIMAITLRKPKQAGQGYSISGSSR